MRTDRSVRVGLALVAAILMLGTTTLVIAEQRPSVVRVSSVGPGARVPEEAWLFRDALTEALASEVMILVLCGIGCGLLVVATEAFDLWQERRKEEAVRLHAKIVKALQHDRLLGHLAVTPIVRLPRWGMAPATVELRGHVPTVWLRYAILRAAERAAAASAVVCQIRDQITIAPTLEALTL
jgi:hypothetical protein